MASEKAKAFINFALVNAQKFELFPWDNVGEEPRVVLTPTNEGGRGYRIEIFEQPFRVVIAPRATEKMRANFKRLVEAFENTQAKGSEVKIPS